MRAGIIASLLAGLLLVAPAQAQNLIPNGQQQFADGNGAPLAGGSVYFYTPGTTTPKYTYQNLALSVPNTNPVLLNSAGRATIWGSGSYREVVYDVNGNLVWDQVTFATGGPPTNIYAVDSGAVNVMAITLSPIPTSMTELVGVPLEIKVNITNTNSTPTLNVNGLGAYNVITRGAGGIGAMGVGTAAAGKIITVIWDGSNFQYLDRIVTASTSQIQTGTDFISPITSIGLRAAMAFSNTSTAGYQTLPTGVIIQWGQYVTTTGINDNVAFPITFPTAVVSFVCTGSVTGGNLTVCTLGSGGITTSAAKVGLGITSAAPPPAAGAGVTVRWMAMGY